MANKNEPIVRIEIRDKKGVKIADLPATVIEIGWPYPGFIEDLELRLLTKPETQTPKGE